MISTIIGRNFFSNITLPPVMISFAKEANLKPQALFIYMLSFCVLCDCLTSSVPCVPTNLTVASTCSNQTTVMWQASLGAQSYRVIAVGNKGHQTTCSSNSTTCSLTDLRCGQVYNVSVVAIDDTCSSPHCQTVTLQTGVYVCL